MLISLRKIFFRLLSLDFLAKRFIGFFTGRLQSLKTELRKKLLALVLRVFVWVLLIGLVQIALLFGFAALALYLNHVLESSYYGFLVVAGGCTGLLLVLLMLGVARWPR